MYSDSVCCVGKPPTQPDTPTMHPSADTPTFFLFQAIVTGRRSFFYSYDVATGKVMKIPRIFSSGRAEKHVETFAASPDGQWLAFIGSGGDWESLLIMCRYKARGVFCAIDGDAATSCPPASKRVELPACGKANSTAVGSRAVRALAHVSPVAT